MAPFLIKILIFLVKNALFDLAITPFDCCSEDMSSSHSLKVISCYFFSECLSKKEKYFLKKQLLSAKTINLPQKNSSSAVYSVSASVKAAITVPAIVTKVIRFLQIARVYA